MTMPWEDYGGFSYWMRDIRKEDWEEFQGYQRLGGGLGYEAWKREGKPRPPTAVAPYTQEVMQAWPGGLPPETRVTELTRQEQIEAAAAMRRIERPTTPTPPGEEEIPGTFRDAGEALDEWRRLGGREAGWRVDWDSSLGRYVLKQEPSLMAKPPPTAPPMSEAERERLRLQEEEAGRAAEQRAWQQQWAQQEARREQEQWEAQQGWQQQQFGLQQEQMAWQQQQAEAQERARLSAQPISWLQYASYTGEQPAVQEWMRPLMPQQYQGLQAGGAIPGWTAESGAGMPQLARPSAQLWGRMGPTAQAQSLGYRQARTGARPEETLWRRKQTAPPGGSYRGLRWAR